MFIFRHFVLVFTFCVRFCVKNHKIIKRLWSCLFFNEISYEFQYFVFTIYVEIFKMLPIPSIRLEWVVPISSISFFVLPFSSQPKLSSILILAKVKVFCIFEILNIQNIKSQWDQSIHTISELLHRSLEFYPKNLISMKWKRIALHFDYMPWQCKGNN